MKSCKLPLVTPAVLAQWFWRYETSQTRVGGGEIGVGGEQRKIHVVPGGCTLSHHRPPNTLEMTRERPLCSGTSAKAQLPDKQ